MVNRAVRSVAVRLVAEGGNQVKAELRGIGEEGQKSVKTFSDELEAANRRMEQFARRAKIAAAAAAAALGAAAVQMVRDGLRVIDSQAKLAASLRTTTESVQVLDRAGQLAGVSMGEMEGGVTRLTRRLSLFANDGGGPAAKAIEQLNLNAAELLNMPLDQRLATINAALDEYATENERAALLSQLFGDRAWQAFARLDSDTLRQATQDVRDFGVVVSQQDAAQIERTNDALSRLGLIWRGVSNQLAVAAAPALESVAEGMAAMAARSGPLGRGIQFVFENLERFATYAGTFVAFLATRWVAGMAMAAASARGLAMALVFLRGALIRTGIGALVVLAGELVYQFMRLVEGAGGLGAAFAAMGAVAVEVWDRIKQGGDALGLAIQSVWEGIKQRWLDALSAIQDTWAKFLESVAGSLDGVPLMGEIAAGVESAANRARAAVDATAEAASAAGENAARLRQEAAEAAAAAVAPLESMERLRELMARTGDQADESIGQMSGALDALADDVEGVSGALSRVQGAAGAAAGELVEGADKAATGWAAVSERLGEYAERSRDLARGIGDSIMGAFSRAEDAVAEFVRTGKLNFSNLVTSIIADLARLAVRRAILAPLADALGGIFGGGGMGGMMGAFQFHQGGKVGAGGTPRQVPAAVFAGAPRFHNGGGFGLRPDEQAAILQRGERVLNRNETREYERGQQVVVNINARDVESFRQSRTQVAADIARAVAFGGRGM